MVGTQPALCFGVGGGFHNRLFDRLPSKTNTYKTLPSEGLCILTHDCHLEHLWNNFPLIIKVYHSSSKLLSAILRSAGLSIQYFQINSSGFERKVVFPLSKYCRVHYEVASFSPSLQDKWTGRNLLKRDCLGMVWAIRKSACCCWLFNWHFLSRIFLGSLLSRCLSVANDQQLIWLVFQLALRGVSQWNMSLLLRREDMAIGK